MSLQDFIDLRKRLGYSAHEVSKSLGLHPSYISRVERGDRPYKSIYYYALIGLANYRASTATKQDHDDEL